MWEIQSQIRTLLDRTLMRSLEVVERMNELGIRCQHSEFSKALQVEKPTPKQLLLLMEGHRILTERLERMNEEKATAIKRAERALSRAESLDSTSR